jgi:hypothetical protein
MNMHITGTLKIKRAEENVSEKFKKREFVITDNSSQYPQHISFQLTQARCGLIDDFEPGTDIRVHFNIRGREWTSPTGEVKYFNSLEAWKIEGAGAGSGDSSASQSQPSQQRNSSWKEEPMAAETDDLPF